MEKQGEDILGGERSTRKETVAFQHMKEHPLRNIEITGFQIGLMGTERRKWVGALWADNAKIDWGQKVIAGEEGNILH